MRSVSASILKKPLVSLRDERAVWGQTKLGPLGLDS